VHLHVTVVPFRQDDLVAPVELVGFSLAELSGTIGRSRRGGRALLHRLRAAHGVVAAGYHSHAVLE